MDDDQTDDGTEHEQVLTVDEYLDRLCWLVGSRCDRFYPPDETAQECIESFEETAAENEDVSPPDEADIGNEYGYHTASFIHGAELFQDMYTYGFDPKERAQRDIERAVEEHDLDGDALAIDWTWWDDYRRDY